MQLSHTFNANFANIFTIPKQIQTVCDWVIIHSLTLQLDLSLLRYYILLGYVIVVVSMATGIMSFNLFAGRRQNPAKNILSIGVTTYSMKEFCILKWFYFFDFTVFTHIIIGTARKIIPIIIPPIKIRYWKTKSCKKYIVNWCNNLQHNPYNSIVFDFCALPCWKIWCKVQWFYWWFCCTNLWRLSSTLKLTSSKAKMEFEPLPNFFVTFFTEIIIFRLFYIGYVFQSFYLEPAYSVVDNIVLPLTIAGDSDYACE